MEPENDGLEDDFPFPGVYSLLIFRGVYILLDPLITVQESAKKPQFNPTKSKSVSQQSSQSHIKKGRTKLPFCGH